MVFLFCQKRKFVFSHLMHCHVFDLHVQDSKLLVQQSDFTLKLKQEHVSEWATECTGNITP